LEKKITETNLLRGPRWSEPVRVIKVEYHDDYVMLSAVGLDSKRYYSEVLLPKDLEGIEILSEVEIADFSGDAEDFFLGVEGHRIRLAYEFDPYHAVNISQIDPLPHQIEAVYDYILKKPRIKFLLADDPGAGKTIMAGLVFKELKYRGIVNRTLIVVPGHLKFQWQREMREKFRDFFEIIDRGVMNAYWGKNIWEERNQCITSMDFAKQEDVLGALREVNWDLVIVDEAHKMAAYIYGDKIRRTERYKLGEVLSKNTANLLFLTATPHKGDPENFRLSLDLLEPYMFAKISILNESISRKENPLFIRRMKEDLRDFDGKPIPPRHVHTIKFELSPPEKRLYDAETRYVTNYYQKAVQRENRNVALALLILQRRLASSVRAIRKSLERRKHRLEEMYEEGVLIKEGEIFIPEEIEDLPEDERWKYEDKIEKLTLAENLDELKVEIDELENLIKIAKEVESKEVETKLTELKKVMDTLNLQEERNKKFLVFTEAKDTLDYIVDKLRSWGYDVTYIHGGMSPDERIDAEAEFRHRSQVMVATEAAGEGINLQFCWLMVNYDIPWNPNRLEQRMGRIHRYGQLNEVHIYNMVAIDTREGQILDKLFEKLEIMRLHLGSDRVFDVIGEVFEGISLEQLIKDALANKRTMHDILASIETIPDKELIEKIRKATAEGLATRHIDLSRIKEEREKAEENRLVPEYIESFSLRAFPRFGGVIEKRRDGFYRVSKVPAKLRRVSVKFKNIFGKVDRNYPKISFRKEELFKEEQVEFVAPGHPLLETVVEGALENFRRSANNGAVFLDPEGSKEGLIWFLQGEVRDGLNNVVGRRLFALYQNKDGNISEVSPAILWDLKPVKSNVPEEIAKLTLDKESIISYAISSLLQRYREELQERRRREIEVKRKYGLKSLNVLISESDRRILEYRIKQMKEGKDMSLPILREEERKEDLMRRRYELQRNIELERNLRLSPPEIIGVAAVFPFSGEYKDVMKEDVEIEEIGMKVAMEYERRQGRNPEDVHIENLGFDIRSRGDGEIRYIEVKARAMEGKIALTPNEWMVANRFGDNYWLYIITNALANPKLHIIQNPAAQLKAIKEVEVVRYLVEKEEWKRVAKEVA
jgi:superfamily II DNA or RNA helicase